MKILEKYIIHNLSTLFLSIFTALFTIASVIFLIKLATYTSIIQLNILEMTKLYIFVLPELFFFTLPLTFFVASALALFRLSTDNEIIVLFSLGIHPKFIIKTLFKPALLLTFLLFFNFFYLFPHAKVLSNNFIANKKSEAKFNLSASEFGHKFGDWLLYLGKENTDQSYSDVFLFNKTGTQEILITADHAFIINTNGVLKLKLVKGEGYSYSKDNFKQTNFEIMYINNTIQSETVEYKNTLEYWLPQLKGTENAVESFLITEDIKKKKTKLSVNILMSLLPILSIFFVASISIINARHQKAKIYLYIFLGIAIYYGASLGLVSQLGFYNIPTVIAVWLGVTYAIYRKTIVARF